MKKLKDSEIQWSLKKKLYFRIRVRCGKRKGKRTKIRKVG